MSDFHTHHSDSLAQLGDRLSLTLEKNISQGKGGEGRKKRKINASKSVGFRVTEDEKETLKRMAQAQGVSLTDYLKAKAFGQVLRSQVDIPAVNRQTYVTLAELRMDINRAAVAIEAIAERDKTMIKEEWTRLWLAIEAIKVCLPDAQEQLKRIHAQLTPRGGLGAAQKGHNK